MRESWLRLEEPEGPRQRVTRRGRDKICSHRGRASYCGLGSRADTLSDYRLRHGPTCRRLSDYRPETQPSSWPQDIRNPLPRARGRSCRRPDYCLWVERLSDLISRALCWTHVLCAYQQQQPVANSQQGQPTSPVPSLMDVSVCARPTATDFLTSQRCTRARPSLTYPSSSGAISDQPFPIPFSLFRPTTLSKAC